MGDFRRPTEPTDLPDPRPPTARSVRADRYHRTPTRSC